MATGAPETADRQRARLRKACEEFAAARGRATIKLLVVGAQHHGKSSFVNHLNRCLRDDAELPDELETAPAGPCENTFEVKTVKIPLGTATFKVQDTPAMSSMSEGNDRCFEEMLAHSVGDGSRRQDFTSSWCSWLWPPAHCAIICVSLPHWQSMRSDTSELLKRYANKMKQASGGKVTFPYVVALTKLDEFRAEIPDGQDEKQLLGQITSEVAESANTTKVFPIFSMKEGTLPDWENTAETFRLLTTLVTFARNQNTGSVQESRNFVTMGVVVVLAALGAVIRARK